MEIFMHTGKIFWEIYSYVLQTSVYMFIDKIRSYGCNLVAFSKTVLCHNLNYMQYFAHASFSHLFLSHAFFSAIVAEKYA